MRILNRRIYRNIRQGFIKYSSIFFLFMFGIMVFVALGAAADSINEAVNTLAESSNCEDGHFNVFVPLNKQQVEALAEKGVTLEENFYINEVDSNTQYTIRFYKNRKNINRIGLKEGTLATKLGEIAIEQHYAAYHGIEVGDSVAINDKEYKVTGLTYSIDYDSLYKEQADAYPDYKNFCVAFVCDEQMERLLTQYKGNYCYSYLLRNDENDFNHDDLYDWLAHMDFDESKISDKYMNEIVDSAKSFDTEGEETDELYKAVYSVLDKYVTINWCNLIFLVERADNICINSFSNDALINKNCALPMGVALFITLSFITATIAVTDVKKDHKIIGTLYAVGYNANELTIHCILVPVITVSIASIIGTCLGFRLARLFMGNYIEGGAVNNITVVYPVYLILYGVVCPILISIIVNWGIIKIELSKPILTIFRGTEKATGNLHIHIEKMKFKLMYQVRQFARERLYYLILMCSLILTIFMVVFGVSLYGTLISWEKSCEKDIKFQYKYYYMFPSEEVPEQGEAALYKLLNTYYPVTDDMMQVELIGLQEGSRYYQCDVSGCGEDEIYASTSAMIKFGWKVGDEVTLESLYDDKKYEFRIIGTQDCSYGLPLFMNIDSMRALFGENDDGWNMVFSDKELAIDSDRLVTTLTKAGALKGVKNRTAALMSNVYVLSCMGIVIFIGMMYMMIGLVTDKCGTSISLLEIMGYTKGEVRQLYLLNSLFITIASFIVSFPISFKMIIKIYPNIIAIVPNGMAVKLPLHLFLLIIVLVIGSWLCVYGSMVRRVAKIDPLDILRTNT